MSKLIRILGIRGATTVDENTSEAIKNATLELLNIIVYENNINTDHIASVFFTLTSDLNAEFPAKFARIHLGWDDVPMMCMQEVAVPESLAFCIRVLVQINTNLDKNQIKHIYLGRAKNLRPDLRKG